MDGGIRKNSNWEELGTFPIFIGIPIFIGNFPNIY
jgi:hypothetical protein